MNVVISDRTEERFRKAIADYMGLKKGNISKALEEAIDLWIDLKAGKSIPTKKARINFWTRLHTSHNQPDNKEKSDKEELFKEDIEQATAQPNKGNISRIHSHGV